MARLKPRRFLESTRSIVGLTMNLIGSSVSENTKNYLLKPLHPIDLGQLKIGDKRNKGRIHTRGVVIIHDLQRKKQYKAQIRNFSAGGLCCEIDSTGSILLGADIMVEFVGELSKAGLDVVKSKVMWATPMPSSGEKCISIGIEFSPEISKTKLKKIADYVETLKN